MDTSLTKNDTVAAEMDGTTYFENMCKIVNENFVKGNRNLLFLIRPMTMCLLTALTNDNYSTYSYSLRSC